MLRSIRRNIAKNLLRDMGYERVNEKLYQVKDPNKRPSEVVVTKLTKTAQGRTRLDKMRSDNPPLWKRITQGDLAKDAQKAIVKAKNERWRQHRTTHAGYPPLRYVWDEELGKKVLDPKCKRPLG